MKKHCPHCGAELPEETVYLPSVQVIPFAPEPPEYVAVVNTFDLKPRFISPYEKETTT